MDWPHDYREQLSCLQGSSKEITEMKVIMDPVTGYVNTIEDSGTARQWVFFVHFLIRSFVNELKNDYPSALSQS